MTDSRTTELREKLTERGVKWVAYEKECNLTLEGFFDTRWDANGVRWSYLEINGKATLSVVGRMEIELTPKQAITATLGAGECEMETDWDYLQNGIPDAPEDTWAYMCSACDWSFRYDRGIKPSFCPSCGAKVRKAVKR